MVFHEEAMIGLLVIIDADGDDVYIGHPSVELEKARQFFDAGSAVCSPEIEDDGMAAQFVEIDGLSTVTKDKLGRRLVDVARVLASIATEDQQQ